MDFYIKDNQSDYNVILLHGYGASGDDLHFISNYNELIKNPNWIFPKGTLKLSSSSKDSRRAWFNSIRDTLGIDDGMSNDFKHKLLSSSYIDISSERKALCKLIKELDLDISKTVIGGFSQGSMLSLDVAMNSDISFLGLAIMSGCFLNQNDLKNKLKNHSYTNYFISHGLSDFILPYENIKSLANSLETNNYNVQLIEFEGRHEIPSHVLLKFYNFLNHIFR